MFVDDAVVAVNFAVAAAAAAVAAAAVVVVHVVFVSVRHNLFVFRGQHTGSGRVLTLFRPCGTERNGTRLFVVVRSVTVNQYER